ncbi:MAG: hypothetical protein Q8K86_10020 [Candidatus Nanopelagicaceae bacterium]|nr:hypothetical protein [Candidatus Nanopelagicaceae bacterium]
MGALSLISDVALAIHIISIIGVMVLLLMQVNKSPRRIHPGTWHSALTALVMGLLMVGIRTPLHNDDPAKWPEVDNTIIGIKFSILIVILVLIQRNYKKAQVRNSIWVALIGLTTANILIALFG